MIYRRTFRVNLRNSGDIFILLLFLYSKGGSSREKKIRIKNPLIATPIKGRGQVFVVMRRRKEYIGGVFGMIRRAKQRYYR